MAKQSFGGEDDGSGQQQPLPIKKLDLKKYASKPDINIRDLFWDLMAMYAMKKKLDKDDLKELEHERIALMRIALNVLENPKSAYFGIGRNLTTLYSIMLLLDANWEDTFQEFIVKSYEEEKPMPQIVVAINKLCENEKYREQIKEAFKKMTRNHIQIQSALAYLSKINNKNILNTMKKEIMIIARSDIEKNQYYAMITLSNMMDEDSRTILIALLSHWDTETRRIAVNLLKKEKDQRTIDAAKRQLSIETDSAIKKTLEKIVKNNKIETHYKDPKIAGENQKV